MAQELLTIEVAKKLLDISIALTAEKDYNLLLEKIVTEARNITRADGGTLYILKKDKLYHKIMQTHSLNIFKGGKGEQIQFDPLDLTMDNVATYTVITKKMVNIEDVYHSPLFDFSGPKHFDEQTGYRTKSMLVFPLMSRDEKVLGVLQLINAQNQDNEVVPFDKNKEAVIASLASQAGLSVENRQHIEEIQMFFESFVKVVAKTIDERTPYNATHSFHIAHLIEPFARYINSISEGPLKDIAISEANIYELVTAAWLHDIGKIVVPIEVLDKPTRLAEKLELLLMRCELIAAKIHRDYLIEVAKAKQEDVERLDDLFEDNMTYMRECIALIKHVNSPSTFVDSELQEKLLNMKNHGFEGIDEVLLTDVEYENLSINKGTLTPKERLQIEDHVGAAIRILSQMTFPDYLPHVFEWVTKHHEYLDGSGYMTGCKAEDIPTEVRILTILDVYDALVSRDRPYKPAMPKDKALSVLKAMVQEGKLDGSLVEAFIESKLWEQ